MGEQFMSPAGPVKFWWEGDILFAENDFVLLAYAVTRNPAEVGQLWLARRTQNRRRVHYAGTG